MPVFWNERIIFGTAEGKLYFLLPSGRLDAVFEAGAGVAGPLFIDLNRLYFSLEDGTFHCLNLASRKRLWKIKTGGFLTSQPASDEKRIFFAVSNNILFCLDKKGGDLTWWQSLSSQAPFSPAVCGDQVLAAALPNLLIAYKKKTGEYVGGFNAGEELKAAALRHDEHLLIGTYNPETLKGSLMFLKGQESKKDLGKK
jgi:outer membrane protein assembly factor BamB